MRAAVIFLPVALGACSMVFGGRPESCGTYPQGGGPAVIATRDEEVCEIVRLRVIRQLDNLSVLERDTIDELIERVPGWEGKRDVDALVAAIRNDAGDDLADEVRRAIDDVVTKSARPLPADCVDVQRCLVKGAARGVRIALLYATPSKPEAPPPAAKPQGGTPK